MNVGKLRSGCLAALFGVMGLCHSAKAGLIYNTSALGELIGSRSVGTGLTIGSGNATAASLKWAITSIVGGYHYSYTLDTSSSQHSISHFILELSGSCVSGGVLADPNCAHNASAGGATLIPGTFSIGPSNPNMPGTITGLKFDGPTSNALPYILSFDSDRAPVYGDFYAKTGSPPKSGYSVFNSGQGFESSSMLVADFIARPDTTIVTSPEPESLALLAAGMAALGAVYYRRRTG